MPKPKPTITTYFSESAGDPRTMLAEAVLVWDGVETRGMHEDVFMLAYVGEHRTVRPLGLTLLPLGPLLPQVQKAPSGLLRAMAGLPPEKLLALVPPSAEEYRVAGLACFRHTWALTGKAKLDAEAGRYTGKAADHPARVRIRLMLGHYAGHTVSLARTADKQLAQLYPEKEQGQIVQALARAAAALNAATGGGAL